MLVFKFGGASVKNAEAVRNIAGILKAHQGPIIVVISAMGKTTNQLERIIEGYVNKDQVVVASELSALKAYHTTIVESLFTDQNHPGVR
jgi:aspartate kinase